MTDVPGAIEEPPRVGSSAWWRRAALRVRAAVAFGVVALVLSASLSLLAYALVRSSLLEDRSAVAERQAFTNARLVRSRIDPLPPDMTQLLAGLQVGPTGNSLLRVGDRWFSSSVEVADTDLPTSLTELVESGGAGTQTVELNGEPTIAVGLPITALDAAYFELGSLANIESTLSSLARALLLAGLVATLLGAALGAALGSVILQPLRRFADVAQRISAGESSSRLDAAGDADLEPLATSFNEMLDELDERIERERRFASDVSHEIRGPVAALASAVSIVDRRRDQLPEEVVPVVDALQEQVTAFNQLVLDLLEISRFDARTARLELVRIDLGSLCRRLVTERGFESVAVHVPEPSPVVLADRRRIEQVLFNLLDNARLYAGGATDLVLVAGERSAAIEIMDRGPGLTDGELDDVFERFRRGSAADSAGAPGTGLGLALSRQHVALHGGSLRVANREGGGAIFTVELPGDRTDGSPRDDAPGRLDGSGEATAPPSCATDEEPSA